jgi:DTW domain-containing protein YfiP
VELKTKFVIVSHPKEARRKTSTGRMLHRSLKKSVFINRTDLDECTEFRNLISDENYQTVLLYPSADAVVYDFKSEKKQSLKPQLLNGSEMKLQIILIDSTWHQAKKIYRDSKLLQRLSSFSLLPDRKSQFKIRTQPNKECLSTIECAHLIIEALGEATEKELQQVIQPFNMMVKQQVDFQLSNNPDHRCKWL